MYLFFSYSYLFFYLDNWEENILEVLWNFSYMPTSEQEILLFSPLYLQLSKKWPKTVFIEIF